MMAIDFDANYLEITSDALARRFSQEHQYIISIRMTIIDIIYYNKNKNNNNML